MPDIVLFIDTCLIFLMFGVLPIDGVRGQTQLKVAMIHDGGGRTQ